VNEKLVGSPTVTDPVPELHVIGLALATVNENRASVKTTRKVFIAFSSEIAFKIFVKTLSLRKLKSEKAPVEINLKNTAVLPEMQDFCTRSQGLSGVVYRGLYPDFGLVLTYFCSTDCEP
jgi:hypothetical protein